MKNILVISSSLRAGSNSELLADSFVKGAQENRNRVEKISLKGKTIQFCTGCMACEQTNECIIKDDMQEIINKIKGADIIVFATPIYYYEMAGQLKTLLDRVNPLFGSDFSFRDIYLLATAADEGGYAVERAKNGLQGWVECFEDVQLRQVVFVGGVTKAKEIEGNIGLLQAYELGKIVK